MLTQHQDTRQKYLPDGGRHDREFVAASESAAQAPSERRCLRSGTIVSAIRHRMIMLPFTGRRSARPESIFAKFWRCPARPSLSSSLDRGMGAQRYLGIGHEPAFLCLVDAFYRSCFCNQRSRYREWARVFLGGTGKHHCPWTDDCFK